MTRHTNKDYNKIKTQVMVAGGLIIVNQSGQFAMDHFMGAPASLIYYTHIQMWQAFRSPWLHCYTGIKIWIDFSLSLCLTIDFIDFIVSFGCPFKCILAREYDMTSICSITVVLDALPHFLKSHLNLQPDWTVVL